MTREQESARREADEALDLAHRADAALDEATQAVRLAQRNESAAGAASRAAWRAADEAEDRAVRLGLPDRRQQNKC